MKSGNSTNPIVRVGQVVVAAFFAAVLVTFWVMMIRHGRGEWLSLERSFSDSGMYVDMHSFIQFNVIGVPIVLIVSLHALQMLGKFPPHDGIRFANRLFLGMGLAVVVVAALYFRLWDNLLPARAPTAKPAIAAPSDENLPYPTLPLRMDLALQDTAGNAINLADFKGKVVFLNVWATWCTFCKLEFPNIQRLYEEFKDNPNVAFLLVSDEAPEVVQAWLQSDEGRGYAMPFYTTTNFGRYDPDGYPTTFIIAPDGQTAFTHSGFVAWDGEKTRAFLRALADTH